MSATNAMTVSHFAKPRLARLRQLSQQHLRSYELSGNTLKLSYDRDAAVDVQQAVAVERQCSALLDFHVSQCDENVVLTIVGPSAVGLNARWLFFKFLAQRMQLPIDYDEASES